MPILSIFFGIVVRMWHDDHPPPHIHVEYQGFEALVAGVRHFTPIFASFRKVPPAPARV